MKFRTCVHASLLLAIGAMTPSMRAAELASATLSSAQVGPTTWLYSIQLNDTGTTNIGTFWFSWIPGEDFMSSLPTDVSSPTGWTDNITHGGASDGYAIQWLAGAGDAITPRGSLTGFSFESAVSPAAIAGNSPLFPSSPELTSFVYSAGPFSDGGFSFTVQEQSSPSAPEPGSIVIAAIGMVLLGVSIRRRIAN